MAEAKTSSVKSMVLPPLVLAIICAVCCAFLALANMVTKDKIAAAEADAIQTSLKQLPDAGTFEEVTDFQPENNEKASATGLYLDENGQYAVLVTADGYNKGGLQVVIGVDKGGAVTGVSFVTVSETPGLGTKVQSDPELLVDHLVGLSDSDAVDGVDNITGATYSSKGMKAAVNCALATVHANQEVNYGKEFTKGILKENPTLVGLLGMCPTLAVTTAAFNGIGMGLSTMFVLICSNIVISLLRKVIPEQVKLPCYIVIIASFVTVIQFLVHGFVPALYTSLGAFLELITVNCIILGRAEMFASKNNVLASALDGAGMGLGFTLALFLMGSVREILGSGTWFGLTIPGMVGHTMSLFVMPAGGFLVLGFVIAVVCALSRKNPPKKIGCASCPNAAACHAKCEEADA